MNTRSQRIFLSLMLAFLLPSCSQTQTAVTIAAIETEYGTIKIRLYDETPVHKENFIRLVDSGYYNNLLFHRVINQFMIQGGDPDSRNANDTALLGSGDLGYTLPAEINSKLYHKKGVLAAARQSDADNPERRSSGGQFYLVQGHTYTDEQLDMVEKRVNQMQFQHQLNLCFMQERDSLLKLGKSAVYDTVLAHATLQARQFFKPTQISTELRNIYKTTGGAPHLDHGYTVFGETIEGFDVIDKIAALPTDANDRPLKNVRMKISIIR